MYQSTLPTQYIRPPSLSLSSSSSLPFHSHGAANSNHFSIELRKRLILLGLLSITILTYLHSSLRTSFNPASSNRIDILSSSSSRAYSAAKALIPPNRVTRFSPAILGDSSGPTFEEYLEDQFPLSESQPHIWLTLADAFWSRTGTSALVEFVRRLNLERELEDPSRIRTVVIVLCMDEECIRNCETAGVHAYGGFMFNRPEQILRSTWPKLAALIEILRHRDAFFVDSDVSFKLDPYPHMEPYMKNHDLVAQENAAFDHFNTGWFWMRKGQVSSDTWNEVLQRDMREVSRDQNNFNDILGTARLRACDPTETRCDGTQPLKSSFVATNGLRVKVLDGSLFRSYHFENDVPSTTRHSSLSLHLTCGDDGPTKIYAQKLEGFWTDIPSGYYTKPSQIVTIEHLSGRKDELNQLVKILLMASHYTNRAFLPPSHATFTDLNEKDAQGRPVVPSKRINSAFPVAHLEAALGVRIVEPMYAQNAAKHLMGGASVVQNGKMRASGQNWIEKEQLEVALSMSEQVDLDMRHVSSPSALLSMLFSSPYRQARIIRLINHDWPFATNWREWRLSRSLAQVHPCEELEERPSCDRICRFKNDERLIRVDQGWEDRKEWIREEETIGLGGEELVEMDA